MTRRENEILFRLEEKFNAFVDSHIEHRTNTESQFKSIHEKIDKGQLDDKEMFDKLVKEIWDDETGLRTRINSLEKTRSNAYKIVGGSGSILGSWLAFKEKIVSLAQNLLHG